MSTQELKFKDIADAIRTKDGTTEPIVANDFASRILAIESGPSLPDNVSTITLTADPENGGTVSGGGVASNGMTITVNAVPDEENNYHFEGWQEGETVVSTEPSYTFLVNGNKTLISKFVELQYILGVDWFKGNSLQTSSINVVYGGDGKFVGLSNTKGIYSLDGVNWNLSSSTILNNNWSAVCFGGGQYIAVGSNTGTNGKAAAISTDGVSWTVYSSGLIDPGQWCSIAYGNGRFVVVRRDSSSGLMMLGGLSSVTKVTIGASSSYSAYSVCFGNGKFVATLYNRNYFRYSEDGRNWSNATVPVTGTWGSVCFGNGKFVAMEYRSSESNVVYSEDGINWSLHTSKAPVGVKINGIVFGNGKFISPVASGNLGKILYSENGLDWSLVDIPFSDGTVSCAYENEKFVATGYSNINNSAYSSDYGPEN